MRTIKCTFSSFGYQSSTPAPAVQVLVFIPRINFSVLQTFLIDTGASGTCLHGLSALRLQSVLDTASIQSSSGIGGHCYYYQERALLVFKDTNNNDFSRATLLGIQKIEPSELHTKPGILRLPSLLGRDILSKCELRYNYPSNETSLIIPD